MGKILILTHAKDGTTDLITEKLKEKNASFVRFDTENFPEKIKLTIKLNKCDWSGYMFFDGTKKIDLKDISVVWNRRPHKPEINSIKDTKTKEWAEEESWQLLKCLWKLMEDRFWVNPIESNEKIQFNKPYQMFVANKIGLKTPYSILTNNPNDVISFCNETEEVALKVIKSVAVHYPEKIFLMHTKKISKKDINEQSLTGVRHSPVFLQKYIAKKTELRITVVGEKVFACEIDSQSCKETEEDWRKHIFVKNDIPHRKYDLPCDIKNKCIRLTKELGLYFGAIDMILTPSNDYVFLEINPNGQWGWIEQLTDMPISSCVADFLIANIKK